MRAAIIEGAYEMRVGEVETPRPGSGEVLVAVGAAGVCAGDLHLYHGRNPYATLPQLCGHEIAGTIAEVAGGAEGSGGPAPGERVVVEPFLGCGQCYPCRIGKSTCCVRLTILGVNRAGGYAEFLTAPATHVHRIPEEMSDSLPLLPSRSPSPCNPAGGSKSGRATWPWCWDEGRSGWRWSKSPDIEGPQSSPPASCPNGWKLPRSSARTPCSRTTSCRAGFSTAGMARARTSSSRPPAMSARRSRRSRRWLTAAASWS